MDGAFKRFRSPVEKCKSAKSSGPKRQENHKEVIPHVCLTCNQSGQLYQSPVSPTVHPPTPPPRLSLQCSPDLTDYLFGSHTLRSTSGIRCVPCQHLSEPPRRASCWSELNSEEAGAAPGGGEEPSMDRVELEWR